MCIVYALNANLQSENGLICWARVTHAHVTNKTQSPSLGANNLTFVTNRTMCTFVCFAGIFFRFFVGLENLRRTHIHTHSHAHGRVKSTYFRARLPHVICVAIFALARLWLICSQTYCMFWKCLPRRKRTSTRLGDTRFVIKAIYARMPYSIGEICFFVRIFLLCCRRIQTNDNESDDFR